MLGKLISLEPWNLALADMIYQVEAYHIMREPAMFLYYMLLN